MRKLILLITTFLSICILPTSVKAGNTVDLTFKFVTINTIDGYDHVSKLIVYCDDKKVSESSQKKQSESNKLIVPIPAGYHTVRATLYALYNGKWESRTEANEYSFNFEYNKTINWNENKTINLTFDINKEETIVSETNIGNNEIAANTQTSNYNDALKKINSYLKTFDNGYYGYLEVVDGYLYDRFSSGEYSKVKISDVDIVTVEETNRKVVMKCKSDKECVFSTYTDSYHSKNSFSQTTDFNTKELVDLLNNLITAYRVNTTSTSTTTIKTSSSSLSGTEKNAKDVREQKEKERQKINLNTTEIVKETKPANTTTNSASYSSALKKLNDYLKTFDNGYYGYFEVKDGYIYDRFKAGKYNKFKMEDIQGAIIQTEYKRVILKCKTEDCISTDWKANGTEDYTQFTSGASYNYQELADLLNKFKDAYLGKETSDNTTYNNSTSTKTEAQQIREQKNKERQQNSKTSNIEDEDWDALEKAAAKLNNSTKEVKESTGTLRAILYDKEIILTDIDNSDPNFDKAKKYIGKKGKTKTYIIPNDDNLTFYGDIYFDGILFKFKKIRIKEVTANENTSSTSSNKNYSEPLKKLNEYLKTFNAETYRDIEVKDGKVYFAFFVYGAKYTSSIDISELKNNTIITIGKSVGSSVVDEVKISCKGGSKCFYSTYSNGNADHFRFFSNSVKDFTKMEQLVKDFIKAL